LNLSAAESVNFHRVPNQVLYQAEPLPDSLLRSFYYMLDAHNKTSRLSGWDQRRQID